MTKNEFTGQLITAVKEQMPKELGLTVTIREREGLLEFLFMVVSNGKKWEKGVQILMTDTEIEKESKAMLRHFSKGISGSLLKAIEE